MIPVVNHVVRPRFHRAVRAGDWREVEGVGEEALLFLTREHRSQAAGESEVHPCGDHRERQSSTAITTLRHTKLHCRWEGGGSRLDKGP